MFKPIPANVPTQPGDWSIMQSPRGELRVVVMSFSGEVASVGLEDVLEWVAEYEPRLLFRPRPEAIAAQVFNARGNG